MHVLIAHYRPDVVSGAELALADFIGGADSRYSFSMLVPGEGGLAAFFKQKGCDVWVKTVQNRRRIAPGLHTLQSAILAHEIKKRDFDLVLCNTFAASSRVLTAANFARRPVAIYVREYIQDKPLHRKMLGRAQRVLAVSADLQRHLEAMVDPGKIRLAYDAIDARPILERLEIQRSSGLRRLPYQPGTPVVGLVGRIARFKQQDLFIRAIPHVLKEVPQARFIVAGAAIEREKEYERSVQELAAGLGLEDRVIFLGHRKDNIEIMADLSVLCLTSTREPLGRVILEANLAGTPVVASSAGGPGEIVEDGVTGMLFPAAAPSADLILAEKIICLLKDPGLRSALVHSASQRIRETFAGTKHIRIIEQHIREIIHS